MELLHACNGGGEGEGEAWVNSIPLYMHSLVTTAKQKQCNKVFSVCKCNVK